jgi:ABC-type nitrate/sulfonate/bicarbonate transport system substrate-binding protein
MSLFRIDVVYGKLEGTEGKFARDPTGYLAIEAGIFRRKKLDVSWQHVQGTEERYRRLWGRAADISFVVGRAALQHFLDSRTTRILGSSMNSCPYYLLSDSAIKEVGDLKDKSLACREGPARLAPLDQVFRERGQLRLGEDLGLRLTESDQDAFDLLTGSEVHAALLPRPYGLIAEECGFSRMARWPDIVDDPLPVMIETTEDLLREKEKEFSVFLEAHREAIRYLKTNRAETLRMLGANFGHPPSLAAKTFADYLVWLDDRLTVDLGQLEKLLAQVAPHATGDARQLASEWILPWALGH